MAAIRQLEPWEQNALRAHDAGNHDAKTVGDEVGRKAKTVRRLWEDATAWETGGRRWRVDARREALRYTRTVDESAGRLR